MIQLVTVHSKGYRNGTSKNMGLRKFWPDLEITVYMFLMGLKVSLWDDNCISESQIFL